MFDLDPRDYDSRDAGGTEGTTVSDAVAPLTIAIVMTTGASLTSGGATGTTTPGHSR